MSIILWIDPGSTTIWFAIINKSSNKLEIIEFWIIETPPLMKIWDKLLLIYNDLSEIIKIYKPDYAWIEKLFFTNNAKTAMDVAEARWVIELALVKKWIQYIEYSPPEIKKWICWNWRANKKQIQNIIQKIFKLEELPRPDDAADALAIAYLASIGK